MSYSLPTCVGDWVYAKNAAEMDEELFELKKKSFKLIDNRLADLHQSFLSPIPPRDKRGHVVSGVKYQIVNKSGGKKKFLCITPSEQVINKSKNYYACELHCTDDETNCVRNTFILSKPCRDITYQSKISANENLYIVMLTAEGPMYLKFNMCTMDSIGHKRAVRLTKEPDAQCLFHLRIKNPMYSIGGHVLLRVGGVLIRHTLSGTNLTLKNIWVPTIFGPERFVTCEVDTDIYGKETMESLWKLY